MIKGTVEKLFDNVKTEGKDQKNIRQSKLCHPLIKAEDELFGSFLIVDITISSKENISFLTLKKVRELTARFPVKSILECVAGFAFHMTSHRDMAINLYHVNM